MTPAGVTIAETDRPEDVGGVGRGIDEFNREAAGDDGFRRLVLLARGPDGAAVGGVVAATYWGWLHVDLLWVAGPHRGRGVGGALLAAAEAEAVRRGAGRAYLDTFSFQAPRFYLARGYVVFGELAGFPPGHTRYWLRKDLTREGG